MEKDQDQRKEDPGGSGRTGISVTPIWRRSWRPGRVLIEGAGLRIGLGPR